MRIRKNRPSSTVARTLRRTLIPLGVTLLLFEVGAQIAWRRLELRALEVRQARGEAVLRDDRIGFMKRPDSTFGYVLIPGFSHDKMKVNADGFAQPDRVPMAKGAGVVRLAALGASTTTGLNTVNANYPVHLGRLVRAHGEGYAGVDVINAGVPGWVSDQVALWSARKVKHYSPDVVVLYIGWNDFQSYNPFNTPPAVSYFESTYGSDRFLVDVSPLKMVSLASALFGHTILGSERGAEPLRRAAPARAHDLALPYASPPEVNYRFYLASLDRIVAAFRDDNPDVRIAICTLAGRWPARTEARFTEDEGSAVWWMRKHGLDPEEAAVTLVRFNDLIRDYAKSRDLLMIDAAAAFATLDRAALQTDFAHLTAEGYELLAEVIYAGLRRGGYVRGETSPRFADLRDKYRAGDPDPTSQ